MHSNNMVSKVVIFACVASAVQMAYGQYIPQVVPACPQTYQPQIISQPAVVPPQTTIIQDSSVSNNLANALQLLVVSSLLSNALPFNQAEVVLPSCGQVLPSCGQVLPVPSCGQVLPSIGVQVPSCGCGAVPSCGGFGQVVSPYGQVISDSIVSPYYGNVLSPYVSAPVVPSCGCGGLGGLGGLIGIY